MTSNDAQLTVDEDAQLYKLNKNHSRAEQKRENEHERKYRGTNEDIA